MQGWALSAVYEEYILTGLFVLVFLTEPSCAFLLWILLLLCGNDFFL